MANKVEIELTTKLQELGTRVSNSSLSSKEKSIASANVSEALNILSKGAKMTAQDFSRVSALIRQVTNNLVKSAAGSAKFIDGLNELQKKLEAAVKNRDEIRATRRQYERTKVAMDASGEPGIRTSEATRFVKESHIANTRGGEYTTFESVKQAANRGVESAANFLANEFREYSEKVLDEYKEILVKEAAANTDVSGTAEEIDKLKENQPESEIAVQEQQFGNELQNLIDALKTATLEIRNINTSGSSSSSDQDDVISKEDIDNFSKLDTTINKQSSSLGKAFKQFTLYAIALRTIKKALHEAISTVRELDRALTEQAMVTGLTREQTYGLLKDYQDMASRLGATTKEVSSTMTEFLRQGRSIAEASKLTEAAVAAAKIAGISTAESINYLTTAVNGFRLSAEDAMRVSDKFAAVAATAAVSYDEIAIALSKVAAQANLAGMSIDYTTALLTKGIETTREAPETIGTALKTVIARMRELTDYGATLEGDTDVNNVESQLAYIGIQLRDVNGELRSTEDVLNELGGKWDDLNANQQAAIAKALAGTRQQSRLIAMMQDYERVTELQQIAERSAGATMAQMSTYLEGMDAALNKVNVAWEKIVSSVVNSDIIINLVNTFATVVENLGAFLDTQGGIITGLITISTIGLTILGNKIRELEISKLQQKFNLQQQKIENEKLISQTKTNIEKLKNNQYEKQGLVDKAKEYLLAQQTRKAHLQTLAVVIRERKEKGAIVTASEAWLQKELADTDIKIAQAEKEHQEAQAALELEKKQRAQLLQQEESRLAIYKKQGTLLEAQDGLVNNMLSGFTGMLIPLISIYNLIKKNILATKAYVAQQKKAAGATAATSVAHNPFWGWAAALAILAAVGLGIAVTAGAFNQANNNEAQAINDLSAEIYNFNKKATELETAINKFDELDKKIVKTNEDLKEMSSILQGAGDSLSEEAKETFDSLSTNAERRSFLKAQQIKTEKELEELREEQRKKILSLKGEDLQNFLYSTESDWIANRDAMRAYNNAKLYDIIDNGNYAEGTEQLVQNLLEALPPLQALEVLQNPDKIREYVEAVQGSVAVFSDETKTIKERVEAYRELYEVVDGDLKSALKTAYSDWDALAGMSDATLEWIDNINASGDQINNFAAAMRKIGIDADDTLETFERLIAESAWTDLETAFKTVFGENAQKMLIEFDKIFGTTILNMSQNMDKFNNKIDSIYETASKWSTLSDAERGSFLSENGTLFEGEEGRKLLEAFNSGNLAAISQALPRVLSGERDRLLESINRQLKIEEAKAERDEAYIQELKRYRQRLEDEENVWLASLETRLKIQDQQLNAYKEYLQRENDALIDSLNKRKEAYEKYFEEINREAETSEYEDKAQMLIANISKLSSSTNADAMTKTADLQRQLEELEKERLQTLREQAQERVIQSIEDEVTQISDNLTKLLENEQALLNVMMQDVRNPEKLIASMLSAEAISGNNTELGMQSYLQNMQSTFAMMMPDIDWSKVSVDRQGDTLILNIEGKQIVLNNDEQQSIYDAVLAALRQIGKN